MSVDILLAVAAMAAATAATRLAGLFVPRGFARSGRLKAAFEAMPVAVLSAIIGPTVLATGWSETLAALLVFLVALRGSLVWVVIVGIGAAAALRALAGML